MEAGAPLQRTPRWSRRLVTGVWIVSCHQLSVITASYERTPTHLFIECKNGKRRSGSGVNLRSVSWAWRCGWGMGVSGVPKRDPTLGPWSWFMKEVRASYRLCSAAVVPEKMANQSQNLCSCWRKGCGQEHGSNLEPLSPLEFWTCTSSYQDKPRSVRKISMNTFEDGLMESDQAKWR